MEGLPGSLILLFALECTVATLMLAVCFIGMNPETYHGLTTRKDGTGKRNLTQPNGLVLSTPSNDTNGGPMKHVYAPRHSEKLPRYTSSDKGSVKRRRWGLLARSYPTRFTGSSHNRSEAPNTGIRYMPR